VTRYRIVIDGRLTARLASSLEGVALDVDDAGTALLVDVASAVDLDGLLQRLGDLGLNIVSLDQQPAPT
jgi:hypothetical protein